MSGIDWGALTAAARVARANAYAPHSGMSVGAALLVNGRIFAGCNVENSSYPVGCCAERGALSAAVAAGCQVLEAVVVVCDRPIPPCGMCRQALVEFNQKALVRLVGDDDGKMVDTSLDALMPDPFII